MKAAVLENINAPLVIGDVEPNALLRGQILIRLIVSGICGSQLQEIAGNKGNAAFVPHLLGHEGCGTVEQIGEGVTTVDVGDKVVVHWRKGDGIEADFPSYTYRGNTMKSGKVTTFSEQSIVSENRVTKVPVDAPNDLCALLGCGLSTALSAVEYDARMQKGERVLVVGLGGLGACFVRASQIAGAGIIVGIDIHDKSSLARDIGLPNFVQIKNGLSADMIESATGSREFDVVIETSGNAASIEATLPLLAGGGRYIMVGQPKPGQDIIIRNALHLFGGEGKTIKATQGGQFSPSRDIPRYITMYEDGKLSIDGLVSHRIRLDEVNEALEKMRSGQANRILIDL